MGCDTTAAGIDSVVVDAHTAFWAIAPCPVSRQTGTAWTYPDQWRTPVSPPQPGWSV